MTKKDFWNKYSTFERIFKCSECNWTKIKNECLLITQFDEEKETYFDYRICKNCFMKEG